MGQCKGLSRCGDRGIYSSETYIGGEMNSMGSLVVLVKPKDGSADGLIRQLSDVLRYNLREAESVQDVLASSSINQQGNIIVSINEDNLKKSGDMDLLTAFAMLDPIYVMQENVSLEDSTARMACKYDLWCSASFDKTLLRLNQLLTKLQSGLSAKEDTALDAGLWSHFISLTFPSIDEAVPLLPELRKGCDAFELRVDLLEDTSPQSIHRQIALLRDVCPLPIVYTVRSEGQIGKFPPHPEKIFALLREGLRAGAEWVDVEACWPAENTEPFLSEARSHYAQTSRLLGSLHVTTPKTLDEIETLYTDATLGGNADMLKVVTGAACEADCDAVHEVGARVGAREGKPYIGLCLGKIGQQSRVLNKCFTPVTHEKMATAAPGQLTAAELMAARDAQGLCVSNRFYLFGNPIGQSLSPSMHNGGFSALLLPHVYGLQESADVSVYKDTLAGATFGGASVTIPHKETIISYLDEVKGAANEIGAVNTIVPIGQGQSRRLIGYNTDWLGIQRPIMRQLLRKGSQSWRVRGSSGLVVGAGGTARAACYAIKDLGLELLIHNRSPDRGKELAAKFGGRYVSSEELADPAFMEGWSKLQVVISTVPGQAAFTLPQGVLEPNTPVVLDAVYKPARTALLEQALGAGCYVVQGASMLLEQGLEQFQLWNRRRAPRQEMHAAVFNGVELVEN